MQSHAHRRHTLAFAAAAALALGCSSGPSMSTGSDPETLGTVSLAYSLPGGEHLSTVDYTLTNGAEIYSGTVDIADANGITFTVSPVAAGSGYIVILNAVSDDGTVECSGQTSDIVVVNRVATIVDVQLVCLRDGGPIPTDGGAPDATSHDAGPPHFDASADVGPVQDTGAGDSGQGGPDAGANDSGGGDAAPDGAAFDSGTRFDAETDAAQDAAQDTGSTQLDGGADTGEDAPSPDSGSSMEGGSNGETDSGAEDATADATTDGEEDAAEDAPEDAEEFPFDARPDGSLFRCPRHHGWKYMGCSTSPGHVPSGEWALASLLLMLGLRRWRRARPAERVSTPTQMRKVSAHGARWRWKALTLRSATVGERLMRANKEQMVGRVALLALAGCCAVACSLHEDPSVVDNGPTFVVVGKSSEQPPLVSQGISMYVEARGGNYVGLLAHGCGLTLAGLKNQAASCGTLPDATDPMYFLVNAVPGKACTIEARLYYVCDDAGLLPPKLNGLQQFEWCDTVGSLMGSVQVPLLQPTDASADGEASADEITDASVPTADVGDIQVGRPL